MSLETWGDEGDIGPEGYVTEEHHAEVIADLLAALEDTSDALLGAFGLVSDPTNPNGWSDLEAFNSYKKARAAIAEATQ